MLTGSPSLGRRRLQRRDRYRISIAGRERGPAIAGAARIKSHQTRVQDCSTWFTDYLDAGYEYPYAIRLNLRGSENFGAREESATET